MAATGRIRIDQCKIILKEYHPAIWRRFYVADNTPLPRLYKILQIVMGWKNCHLHSFEHDGFSYAEDDPEGWYEPDNHKNEERHILRHIADDVGSTFMYLYDFGDNWEHTVIVEDIVEDAGVNFPICIDGKRACPPEDCHGPHGYKELLETLADPGHQEYQETTEWLERIGRGGFNSEEFNLNQINEALSRVDDYFPDIDEDDNYY